MDFEFPAEPFIDSRGVRLGVYQAHAHSRGDDDNNTINVHAQYVDCKGIKNNEFVCGRQDWVGVRGPVIDIDSRAIYQCSFVACVSRKLCVLSHLLCCPEFRVVIRDIIRGDVVWKSHNLLDQCQSKPTRFILPFQIHSANREISLHRCTIELGFYPSEANGVTTREFFASTSLWSFTIARADSLVRPALVLSPLPLLQIRDTKQQANSTAFDNDPNSVLVIALYNNDNIHSSVRQRMKEWASSHGAEIYTTQSHSDVMDQVTLYRRPSRVWIVLCADVADSKALMAYSLTEIQEACVAVKSKPWSEWVTKPHKAPKNALIELVSSHWNHGKQTNSANLAGAMEWLLQKRERGDETCHV